MEFSNLFNPITINGMELKNRMMVSAMVTQYCGEDGFANEQYIKYHETKAKGGWGLIITENYPVAPKTGSYARMAALYTDEHIAGHKELTDRVHKAGGKICCQLYHGGATTPFKTFNQQSVAPSHIRTAVGVNVPREMTIEEIHTLIKQFGESALRAKKAGFDAVEIHGGHGYLLHEFLSPAYNKRTDEYGGSLYNRCRLSIEIVEEVRKQVGKDFPIFFRISSHDYRMGGLPIAETRVLAMRLEDAGVDCIDISQGDYSTAYSLIPPSVSSPSTYIENARAIRSVVNIPITSAGKIYDPFMAESILKEGAADLVVMARTSLADPDFPNKVKNNQLDSIRNCIGCVQACTGGNKKNLGCHCTVNPMLGHEAEYDMSKVENPKNVIIIGAGVAGCEAAIAAATKGHKVTVYEKENKIGGQWIAAAIPTGKTEFNSFLYWQLGEMKRLGVEIHFNTTVTNDMLEKLNADEIIVATGSVPAVPPIKGIDQKHVFSAEDILRGRVDEQYMAPNKNIVVIGGGMTGSETAEYLAQLNCKVSLVEMLPNILNDGEASPNKFVIEGLKEHDAHIYTSSSVQEIGNDYVVIKQNDQLITLNNIDTVVVATGVKSVHTLKDYADENNIKVICTGDASSIKNGMKNIWEGFKTGYDL
jgi:2,4-dienoyl-CoA reductase-like NADH-dependent reductase (Old Yellow Enzyme family)/thioredoxin reductase